MYSRFLEEAGRPEAPLAAQAAGQWSSLANAARTASEEDAEPGDWSRLAQEAERVLGVERALWSELGAAG